MRRMSWLAIQLSGKRLLYILQRPLIILGGGLSADADVCATARACQASTIVTPEMSEQIRFLIPVQRDDAYVRWMVLLIKTFNV